MAAFDGTKYSNNDIHLDNIVLDEHNNPKFIDFGNVLTINEDESLESKSFYSDMREGIGRRHPYTAVEKDLFALKNSLSLSRTDRSASNSFSFQERSLFPK